MKKIIIILTVLVSIVLLSGQSGVLAVDDTLCTQRAGIKINHCTVNGFDLDYYAQGCSKCKCTVEVFINSINKKYTFIEGKPTSAWKKIRKPFRFKIPPLSSVTAKLIIECRGTKPLCVSTTVTIPY